MGVGGVGCPELRVMADGVVAGVGRGEALAVAGDGLAFSAVPSVQGH